MKFQQGCSIGQHGLSQEVLSAVSGVSDPWSKSVHKPFVNSQRLTRTYGRLCICASYYCRMEAD